ncbi:MAG: hypothetical protein ACRCVY_08230 [Commensalibacter sp.]
MNGTIDTASSIDGKDGKGTLAVLGEALKASLGNPINITIIIDAAKHAANCWNHGKDKSVLHHDIAAVGTIINNKGLTYTLATGACGKNQIIRYVSWLSMGYTIGKLEYNVFNSDHKNKKGGSPSGMISPQDSPSLISNETNFHYEIYDPLILDLNGDGVKTTGFNFQDSRSVFDMDGDGIKNATGWVDKNDGLLVFDRNNDGIINDGSELFGNYTKLHDGTLAKNGFEALAEFDTNKDGFIDKNDKDFDKLKIWRDANSDGTNQNGELYTLEELGITRLSLNHKDTNQNLDNGNTLAQLGSYETKDGQTHEMGDANFDYSSMITEYKDQLELTDQQKLLPSFWGVGRLRDLQQSTALSKDLQDILTQYANATTKAEQIQLLPKLLDA